MGLPGPFSRSSCSESSHPRIQVIEVERIRAGNPNPKNFKILRCRSEGKFTIALIEYLDCFNYEGKKILVFDNVSVKDIKELQEIDPHFCKSKRHKSPIARFVPTKKGWRYAISFCKNA